MQRNDRWPSDYDPDPRSRRGSASSRTSKKKSPPASATSTPKKVVKPQNFDFVVTGRQLLKKADRANSLPGSYRRRPSLDTPRTKKPASPKRLNDSQSSKSRETSLEDDASLELSQISLETPKTKQSTSKKTTLSSESQSSKGRDTSLEEDATLELSQVSEFEDVTAKYGGRKFSALATSTPRKRASLPQPCKWDKSGESGQKSGRSVSVFRPPSVSYRQRTLTEPDSSVSPEYSQSSIETSPAQTKMECSQDLSSCCVSTWLEDSDDTRVEDNRRADGEWNSFWVNYNNSIAKVPVKRYYDQCPTPYRTENIDMADLDFSETSRKRSPEDLKNINSIIRNEGLHLTPRETQNMIKCAHILGSVLSRAIERRSREKEEPQKVQELNVEVEAADTEKDQKKKSMTLNLKETNVPAEVKEEKRSETVTTQTDISLPNTKSAPRIFENILRQLSRSSIDEASLKKAKESLEGKKEVNIEKREEKTEKKEENTEKKEEQTEKKEEHIEKKQETETKLMVDVKVDKN